MNTPKELVDTETKISLLVDMETKDNALVPVSARQESRLLLEILKCSQVLQREINQALRGSGLKYQQFVVLDEIIWNGPVTQKMVCENLLFEKSNISKIVRLLQDRALIQIKVYPGDMRSTLLSETAEGIRLWEQCVDAFNQLSDGYFHTLTKAEINETIRVMKKIQKGIKQRR